MAHIMRKGDFSLFLGGGVCGLPEFGANGGQESLDSRQKLGGHSRKPRRDLRHRFGVLFGLFCGL